MAQAKFEKLGTIYTRIKGLIRGGALRFEDRPLWYDIYEKYPPINTQSVKNHIPKLIYPEDYIRAYFYDNIGQNGIINLLDPKTETICQKYVEKYCEILQDSTDDNLQLFEKTKNALETKGIIKDNKFFNKNIN
ncbi:unnamed protein product [Gordionus sp. m RMFG-2023]|uniref:small ribosomal subunit protein mS23-like n=1 Tax=Gordionus sp. m RMFG-2023 TaxID=3053472 RepID=UPI0030E4F678